MTCNSRVILLFDVQKMMLKASFEKNLIEEKVVACGYYHSENRQISKLFLIFDKKEK